MYFITRTRVDFSPRKPEIWRNRLSLYSERKTIICFQKGLLHENRFLPKLSFGCVCIDSVLRSLICMDHTYWIICEIMLTSRAKKKPTFFFHFGTIRLMGLLTDPHSFKIKISLDVLAFIICKRVAWPWVPSLQLGWKSWGSDSQHRASHRSLISISVLIKSNAGLVPISCF